HHAERELGLELGATRPQHLEPACRCPIGREFEQRCLADARRSLDDQDTAVVEQQVDRFQLVLPLEELHAVTLGNRSTPKSTSTPTFDSARAPTTPVAGPPRARGALRRPFDDRRRTRGAEDSRCAPAAGVANRCGRADPERAARGAGWRLPATRT